MNCWGVRTVPDTRPKASAPQRQLTYGISGELQKLLEQHDGLSRSVPTRTNAIELVPMNGSGEKKDTGTDEVH